MSTIDRWRLLRAAAVGTLIAAGAIGSSALADPAPPYADLLGQAKAAAPRLAQSAAQTDRAQGLARQAKARPNPTLGLLTENVGGSGPYKDFDRAETTLSLSQPLELGGRRDARIGAGAAELEAARTRQTQSQAQFAYALALAYVEAEASQVGVTLAEDEVEEAEADAKAAQALVEAGKEARLRALRSQASLDAMRAELTSAKAGRDAAMGKLTALAAAPVPITTIEAGVLETADRPPVGPDIDVLSSPDYLVAKAERDAIAKAVRVEKTRAVPEVTAVLGVRRFAGDDATAFTGGLSMPLPLFDRNRGNVDAAQASLREADARLEAARLDVQAEAMSARGQVLAASQRLAATKTALATAEEAYRLTRIGYDSGKADLTELLTARHDVGAARASVLEARLARVRADAALARLSGRVPFGDTQP
jgi:cobalt-zinc-cadmium efflux system outer membrane protein